VGDRGGGAPPFALGVGREDRGPHEGDARIDAEAALDGIYVIGTNVGDDTLDPADAVVAYKNLAALERDWRNIKIDDLDLRPIHHYLTGRVEAHLLICMLAQYLVWHLRCAWAPLTFTDEQPPHRDNPVTPATRSNAATAKARTKADHNGVPVRSFRDLLDHLATLTRNTTAFAGRHIDVLATPTATQRCAFELIGANIPVAVT
jgi:hypothetical protein